jgi:hypothetical protein
VRSLSSATDRSTHETVTGPPFIFTAPHQNAAAFPRGRWNGPAAREGHVTLERPRPETVPRAHRIAHQERFARRRADIKLTNIIPKWLLGAWFTAVAAGVASSVSLGARFSTTVLLLVVGVAPAVIMYLIQAGAAPPTVAEILYAAANTKDDRL